MSSPSPCPSPSPSPHGSYEYSSSARLSLQHTPPMRPRRLTSDEGMDIDVDLYPPSSPAKSSTSSLSATAVPFAPTFVDTQNDRNATHEYLTHLAKEAQARYAADKHRSGEKDNGVSGATVLQVSDLHWFTQDAHLIEVAAALGIKLTFKDVTFLEHKCNGKSKGIAFINCHTTTQMLRLLRWFETNEFQGKKISTSISTNMNGKPSLPPPTHDKENGGLGYRPNNDGPTRAPLPFLPTNTHGGVNFNRVPLHHRQQMQQMQQAGFLQGGSYARGNNMNGYSTSQNAKNAYTADLVHKKVMGEREVA
ncbi:hypothetical protein CC85DRAFT_286248 [Cutaneotrichosporon oleaginosum]|uniref:RRM domain-containing protein n=1 Tax=Cutaneotrichosporon oleaginosum TaxID=879819 RepID=A0A0J0XKW5_9TREE|nr:uncharacterized protein CC85DRAFT_286248 [Cutaneotrichosporon oleaginosum]KLT41712.1 hypothetical protein CC85DRAFT_286248 [Cutaneotrichosporon oleaginosum]TXT08084.1 hypothetical protein COLE_05008 [Cutaneotrichosporon oleaginosum]